MFTEEPQKIHGCVIWEVLGIFLWEVLKGSFKVKSFLSQCVLLSTQKAAYDLGFLFPGV